MDPDAALAEIRDIVRELENTGMNEHSAASRAYRLAHLIRGLDEWFSGGGYLPPAWASGPGWEDRKSVV